MNKTVTVVLAMLLLAGCASSQKGPAEADVATAPTPYTAEQIRAANPPGTHLVFRIDAEGQPPLIRRTWFIGGDEQRAIMEASQHGLDGAVVGARQHAEATWDELRDHAAFPAERTTRERARVSVVAGTFECWRYEVERTEDGETTISRFWFADERPGPPVLMETQRDGEAVFRMELVEDSRALDG